MRVRSSDRASRGRSGAVATRDEEVAVTLHAARVQRKLDTLASAATRGNRETLLVARAAEARARFIAPARARTARVGRARVTIRHRPGCPGAASADRRRVAARIATELPLDHASTTDRPHDRARTGLERARPAVEARPAPALAHERARGRRPRGERAALSADLPVTPARQPLHARPTLGDGTNPHRARAVEVARAVRLPRRTQAGGRTSLAWHGAVRADPRTPLAPRAPDRVSAAVHTQRLRAGGARGRVLPGEAVPTRTPILVTDVAGRTGRKRERDDPRRDDPEPEVHARASAAFAPAERPGKRFDSEVFRAGTSGHSAARRLIRARGRPGRAHDRGCAPRPSRRAPRRPRPRSGAAHPRAGGWRRSGSCRLRQRPR